MYYNESKERCPLHGPETEMKACASLRSTDSP
uniref:Uncharacterized protein n=1 Tax=Anguilla anguilla TaxID=7936 RepID=A0A0E9R6P5_ANGAN